MQNKRKHYISLDLIFFSQRRMGGGLWNNKKNSFKRNFFKNIIMEKRQKKCYMCVRLSPRPDILYYAVYIISHSATALRGALWNMKPLISMFSLSRVEKSPHWCHRTKYEKRDEIKGESNEIKKKFNTITTICNALTVFQYTVFGCLASGKEKHRRNFGFHQLKY